MQLPNKSLHLFYSPMYTALCSLVHYSLFIISITDHEVEDGHPLPGLGIDSREASRLVGHHTSTLRQNEIDKISYNRY